MNKYLLPLALLIATPAMADQPESPFNFDLGNYTADIRSFSAAGVILEGSDLGYFGADIMATNSAVLSGDLNFEYDFDWGEFEFMTAGMFNTGTDGVTTGNIESTFTPDNLTVIGGTLGTVDTNLTFDFNFAEDSWSF